MSRLAFIDTRRTLEPVRRRIRSRGVPPALSGHEVFYTEDTGEAEHLIGKTLAPTRLTLGEVGARGFAAHLHGVRLRDISLLYLDLHVAATLDIEQCGPYYAVHMPTNGRAVGTINGHGIEANTVMALVTNPQDRMQVRLDHDSPQLIVHIRQDALDRHLMRLIGRVLSHPVGFEPTFDLTTAPAMRWNGAIQLLHTEVFYEGSLAHKGQGIGSLEEFIMSSLLLVQPSNYHSLLAVAPTRPGRRAVRNALDYIEAHLSEPITMSDLAEHTGGSIRSIQQGFRDELGCTPMAYLRDRRLERAHQELIDADPAAGITVTDVAQHWGFNHLGSFAVLYRKRWGESPSETLRR
ncbi:AraC family transcriptional regulator [Dactylosporangium sp. CA-233914]|uniref:AraC family transcriptional regulator n=1 Tax=Dactylosporangium sp. CA-233914 TaxID=3239934 RepID=UPI003D91176E